MKETDTVGSKKAGLSYWARIKPAFVKHGDLLLFGLALAVLAAILLNRPYNKVIPDTMPSITPSIVFTQWWQDYLENDTLMDLAEEFEKLHANIKVVIKDAAYEDLRDELFYPGETGYPGDVLALDPLWVPELLRRETIEYGDATPFLSFINVLYYNIEILKDAGFSRPPKSRSEFINYLKTINGKEESRWGITLDSKSSRGIYDNVLPWIWSAGAQLIKDGKPALNSRQLVESLSFLASLHKEGFIDQGSPNENKLEDFITGKTAFMIASSGDIVLVRERMGDEAFGVSSIPTPDNYSGISFFASTGWTASINSASEYKEEARLFAAFLAEKATLLSEKAHAIPGTGNQPAAYDPFYSKVWDITIAAEPAQDFDSLPFTELEQIFREELYALFEGKITPAEAAGEMQAKWSAKL